MTDAPISLVDRAGLDRPRLAKIISRGLDGADDGELFLEYRQSEALVFDNGRLKQATYDTSQGFGLRAVKDEAVGYAHASDVSEAAIARAADAVRAVKGGYSGQYADAPARTNVKLYGEDSPLGSPTFEAKARLLETIDAYARAKDPRVRQVSATLAATWQAVEILRGDGETYRDIRPLVRLSVSVVVGDGTRQETGGDGYGGVDDVRKEGQGSALDSLGPSRLGVLRTTAPDPVLSVPRLASAEIKSTRSTVLRVWYRGLPPRSANDSGGTPSWVQGAEPHKR